MEFIDYYKTMGLDDTATSDEIKRAYRTLARKYHPDVSKETDSEARFKELGEAYAVLKDEQRRREYDELKRHRSSPEGGFNPPPGWQYQGDMNPDDFQYSTQGGQGSAEFSDFFEQIFGSRYRHEHAEHSEQRSHIRGQDVHTRLPISLYDAFHGASVEVAISLPVVQAQGNVGIENKTLKVKIPVGVVSGQKIRLRGQGGPSVGDAQPGDLYIEISIKEDEVYHLDGRNVTVDLPVTPWEAALGAVVEVPTLDGPVNLTVPKNAKQGQRLRLKGRGLPGKPPGDQYAVVIVVVPEATTDEQKALYESMRKMWKLNPRSTSGAST